MGPAVTDGTPAPTHDLLRVQEAGAVTADGPIPPWVGEALARTPWVVVRRGCVRAGMLPVGVRGPARSQRFAAWLAVADAADRKTPEDLRGGTADRDLARAGDVPALAALARVTPVLSGRGDPWGPGGSVGFELATGSAAAGASSDLDVILRRAARLSPAEAAALHAALAAAAAPARVDVILETPCGGVALAEWAAAPPRVLVRTPDGPRLVSDPWAVGVGAGHEGLT